MYSSQPSIVLGFHGCDQAVADQVLSGKERLLPSENSYDWLGHGIYFWENNPARALEYAKALTKHPERSRNPVTTPAVVGAVIDFGHCLNLLETKSIDIVRQGYKLFLEVQELSESEFLPENKQIEHGFPMMRHLDCAVMETIHTFRQEEVGAQEFDSVRAMFPEGKTLYPNAGFLDKNHVQVCIRNLNCIKGYFRVLDPVKGYSIP